MIQKINIDLGRKLNELRELQQRQRIQGSHRTEEYNNSTEINTRGIQQQIR